jgi:hypothetical protein
VLRAGRATDFGVAGSTIAIMVILMMFLFPLLSRPAEPPETVVRKPAGVALQTTAAPVKPAVAAEAPQPPLAEDPHRQVLLETSLGLTLIVGAALIAMALGSRGRPS